MPSINMISPRRAEKLRLEANVRRLLLVILAEVVIAAGVAGFLVTSIFRTQSRISDLEVQIAKLRPTVDRIAKFEKDTSELKPKLDTLNVARATTLRWQRVLDDLSTSLPQKTWLTKLAVLTPPTPDTKQLLVSLNGLSPDQQTVGETMLRIQNGVPDFDKLDLHFTQRATCPTTCVEFEIAASVKLAEEDKKEVGKS